MTTANVNLSVTVTRGGTPHLVAQTLSSPVINLAVSRPAQIAHPADVQIATTVINASVIITKGGDVKLASVSLSSPVINLSVVRTARIISAALVGLKGDTGQGSLAADNTWTAAGQLIVGTGHSTAHILAAGALTQILVGGGAADPVWTTATGSGAPVRAISPALVTPALGIPTSGVLTNCTGLPQASVVGLTVSDSPVFVTTKLSGLSDGKIPYHVNDATGLADGPTKTDVDDAVTKKHTQGTDTTLGTMAADINMNSHQLTSLAAPDANGEAVRATTKITEALLESATDLKHTRSHALDATDDHSIGSLTSGYLVKSDGSKLAPATNTDSAIASAVTLVGTTLTDHGILLGSGTAAITPMSVLAAGEIVVGVAGADPHALAAGATTKILVGGGAADPVWTEATGSGAPVRAAGPTLTGDPLAPTAADSDVTAVPTQIANLSFVAQHAAMVKNPLLPAQEVNMTAAASGSNGITVADNNNIDFGTGNFTLVWRGSLPDWTQAALELALMFKYESATDRWRLIVDESSKVAIYCRAGDTVRIYKQSDALTLGDGTVHEIVVSVTRESAGGAGVVDFYSDGISIGSRSITAATTVSLSNTGNLYVSGTNGGRTASTTHFAATFNRALTAAEVLSLYRNGVDWADKWGSQTSLITGDNSTFASDTGWWTLSGATIGSGVCSIPTTKYIRRNALLTPGKKYRLTATNGGAGALLVTDMDIVGYGTLPAGATTSIEFTAGSNTHLGVQNVSGVTNTLDNITLYEIGATLALEPEGIQGDKWYDSSSNDLHASYPASGSSLVRKNWYAPVFNVCSYGAAPTASAADNTTAFRAALADAIAVNGTMYVPHGHYDISDQLNVTGNCLICGESNRSIIHQTANKPLFYVTVTCTIEKFGLLGADNAAYTSNDLIYIDNTGSPGTNVTKVNDVHLADGYNLIHLTDVFYSSFNRIWFMDFTHHAIYTDGSSAAGNAFELLDCKCISNATKNAGLSSFYFSNVGAILIDSLMANMGAAAPYAASHGIVFNTFAAAAGMSQISNSAIEPHGVNSGYGIYLKGANGANARNIYISNSYIAGCPSIYIDYGQDIHISNTYLTGDGSHGALYVNTTLQYLTMSDVQYEVGDPAGSTTPVITANAAAVVKYVSITNPTYHYTEQFIDLDGLSLANCTNISVLGGCIGTHATPITLPSGAISTNLNYDGPEFGTWTPALAFGTAGDLNVTYTVQYGTYTKIGKMVTLTFEIDVNAFTYTTSSGELHITGLPFTSDATYYATGTMRWGGITKANYTQINPDIPNNTSYMRLVLSGSGQNNDIVDNADAASGSNVVLYGSITYRIA